MSSPAPTFDLQSHSLHSDGSLDAPSVVAAAAQAGVELLALTDHDTVDGVPAAAREAKRRGISLVAGVEISAIDAEQGDLHILGYTFDAADAGLGERLRAYRRQRLGRAEAMQAALRELGFELDDAPMRARASAGESIGRPHLARAVTDHPANASRLAAEGCADPSALLEAYLIPGTPAFRPRQAPSVADAIETIHAAGGVAVWAHPFWDVNDPAAVLAAIDRFVAAGLDGVECFYVTHDREQSSLLAERCDGGNLLSTGSADFHGPEHRKFNRFRAFSTFGRGPRLGPLGACSEPSR